MKHILSGALSLLVFLPFAGRAAVPLPQEVMTSTVFIVNYDDAGNFLGWGSGFFVDEGIIVTNKHVIEAGDWYRVYATGADGEVDMFCYKSITKSDVKINLDDDVAYMRAYLSCPHGMLNFAEDPLTGDEVSVMGYPYRGSVGTSTGISITTGTVNGVTADGWFLTNAHLDVGSSGGPVVNGSSVLGVAVAKGVAADGSYLTGYFIPSSVILEGLLYANNSLFGYTPRSMASVSRSSAVSSARSSSSSVSSSALSRSGSSVRSAASSRSSYQSLLHERTCARVARWFSNDVMLGRVNARLLKRFGFTCGI